MRILALVPQAGCVTACLDAATAAARTLKHGHVEALHIRVEPLELVASDEEVAIQLLRESREGSAAMRARETSAAVAAWMRDAPPDLAKMVEYREIVGAEEDEVVRASRAADFLVMARPGNLDAHDAFHAALFLSRKPMLLAPAGWKTDPGSRTERHILIAWKPTRQASRAVDGALSWLRVAHKVTVLTVDKPGQQPDPAELLEKLAAMDIQAERLSAEPIDGRISARILATAEDVGASLIVMGAYRHNALIEWALGATTRRTIARAKIPLMLAH